jgi:hypothetical protein
MSKLGLAAAALLGLVSCTPQTEIERERAYMAQVDRNPAEFQAACDARAGARLVHPAAPGGIATTYFRWPEDQDLLFLWGASFVEINSPHRTLGAEQAPNSGPLGLEGLMTPAELLRAPADASSPFRVRLLPDGDPRCTAGNSQRDTAIAAGRRPGEQARWERNGLHWPYTDARHQTEAAYYRGQCLAVVDATDAAAFHAPAAYEIVSDQFSHPPFRAGAVEVRMRESWRRLVNAQTKDVLAEQTEVDLSSVDEFANYMGNRFAAHLNRCTGAERGRPTALYALRPFTAAN